MSDQLRIGALLADTITLGKRLDNFTAENENVNDILLAAWLHVQDAEKMIRRAYREAGK